MDTNRMDFKRQTLLILIKLVTKIRLEPPLLPQTKIAIPLKVRLQITHSEIENNNVVLGCCFFFYLCLPIYQTCLVITKKKVILRSYQEKKYSKPPSHSQNETPTKSLEFRPAFVSSCKMFHFQKKLEFDLNIEISPFNICNT